MALPPRNGYNLFMDENKTTKETDESLALSQEAEAEAESQQS
ncbi:MAG: hypothetical protein ACI87E_004977, partial [Mariniblastus sp.]